MTTMTRRLITLLGCTTLWACSIERTPGASDQSASALTEDGTGSGSGSGSDTEPGPEACNCDAPGAGSDTECTGGPSQADLDYAKAKLQAYLMGCTGQAAADKLMNDFDTNKDGNIDKAELLAFLKKVGIGNFVTRGEWCKGVLKDADANGDGKLSAAELKSFLDKIGLGAPGNCATEDTAPVGPL